MHSAAAAVADAATVQAMEIERSAAAPGGSSQKMEIVSIRLRWVNSMLDSLEARVGPSCAATRDFTPPSMAPEAAVAAAEQSFAAMDVVLPTRAELLDLAHRTCLIEGHFADGIGRRDSRLRRH